MEVGNSEYPFPEFLEHSLEVPKGTMSYWIEEEGKKDVGVISTTCMGWMSTYRRSLRPDMLLIFVSRYDNETKKGMMWDVLNTGPSADSFITKDVDEGLKSGFLMDVNIPYADLLFSIQCLREINFGCKYTWGDLATYGMLGDLEMWVEAGASTHLALALSSRFDPLEDFLVTREIPYDHAPYSRYVDLGDIEDKVVENKKSLKDVGFNFPETRVDELFRLNKENPPLPDIKGGVTRTKENMKMIVDMIKKGDYS